MINPDMCCCCGEIWNRDNLQVVSIGKHKLLLCPDCYGEYIGPFKVGKEINSVNVQVLIEIPKAMYDDIRNGKDGYNNYICSAIRNGTVSTDY